LARRLIETEADVAEGAEWLAAREPRFAHALALTGPPPLRRKPGGFAALVEAIVAQQVSVASAAAISARMASLGLTTAEALAAASDDTLRAAGLTRPKQRYLRALAAASLDYDGLHHAEDDEVVHALVALPGIGVWTAEIYALFALGRADVFAAGDLALQEAARLLFGLPARPPEKALRQMAAAWSPWRGVAVRVLWAYYQHVKAREGVR
jgi:DNA-3-methyladenine glycosylase II